MTFESWFFNLLRPRVRHMYTKLYENGVPKPISFYNQEQRELIRQSVETLLLLPKESAYRFQCHIVSERSCFYPPITYFEVSCFKEEKSIDIPIRYRKRLFDAFHEICPGGDFKWPARMEVKFVTLERRNF